MKKLFNITAALLLAAFCMTACGGNLNYAMTRIPPTGDPPFTFTMGSLVGEAARRYNERPREVTLPRAFLMGKYEVTQELYAAVMLINPSHFDGSHDKEKPARGEAQAKRPVERVSWFDAIVFCNKLSILRSLTPVYSIYASTAPADWGETPDSADHENHAAWNAAVMNRDANGYRLPTEAEWEFAARAGTDTAWSFGDNEAALGDYAWYESNSGGAHIPDREQSEAGKKHSVRGAYNMQTHEVGRKLPNAWGLFDMHGNVWEWCWNRYGGHNMVSDALFAGNFAYRVNRGGSWRYAAEGARSAFRHGAIPQHRDYDMGFRLARNL